MKERSGSTHTLGWLLAILLSASLVLVASAAGATGKKVTLCHVPPHDPSNAHEILVGRRAMRAHLRHHPGDHLGPCREGCERPTDCDDGNFCTVDTCNPDGSCDNSQSVSCSDGSVCTIDACDPNTGCVNPPVPNSDAVACDDGNACSAGDVCVDGVCSGISIPGCCASDADCPESDACVTRYCEDATSTCKEVDRSSECPAEPCEVAFCHPADGCGTAPATCPDDGDVCTVAECNPNICGDTGGCEVFPNPNPPEPGFEVTCDDGLDNDCDGVVDGADPDCEPCDPEVCDGIDNDCDGMIDEGFDQDFDGFTVCGGDCNDSDPDINPDIEEVCDGLDNDCSGEADFPGELEDLDGDGALSCNDCDDTDPNNYFGNTEVCDGQDNDCMNGADFPGGEENLDGDPQPSCFDCDDNDPNRYFGNPEVCDGLDNDCDAEVDEDAPGTMCGIPPNVAVPVCLAGSCEVGVCATGFADCDSEFGNGCECTL